MHASSTLLLFISWKLSLADLVSNEDLFNDEYLASNEADMSFQRDPFGEPNIYNNVVTSTGCANQQNLIDEPFLFAREDDSCDLPFLPPPEIPQLFQNPLDSLEQIFPAGDVPEETELDDDVFEKPLNAGLDKDPDPCEAHFATGHIYHICCRFVRGAFPSWRIAWDCRHGIGKFLTSRRSAFRVHG